MLATAAVGIGMMFLSAVLSVGVPSILAIIVVTGALPILAIAIVSAISGLGRRGGELKPLATRLSALIVILAIATETTAIASVGPREAAYVGGTLPVFKSAVGPVKGTIRTSSDEALTFEAVAPEPAGAVTIPYTRVVGVEYGQKAGRRVGAAIGYTILAGPAGLLALLSKKRRHYVTVAFTGDDGRPQVAVFEVGKDAVRSTLATVAARSGKTVVYQDQDARRAEIK
jgi:hypothetical protein